MAATVAQPMRARGLASASSASSREAEVEAASGSNQSARPENSTPVEPSGESPRHAVEIKLGAARTCPGRIQHALSDRR
jgi:hypothetical protein